MLRSIEINTLCCNRGSVNSDTKNYIHNNILRSRWWTIITLILTIILLFGPETRVLLVPKKYDYHVDYFFLCIFGILVVDILTRCYASPGYFQLSLPSSSPLKRCITLGSFMFWCDFLSTMILLSDVSLFNYDHFQQESIEINFEGASNTLDDNLNFRNINWNFFLSVCRSARVARFARASSFFVNASKVNMYHVLCNRMFFWLRNHQECSNALDRCYYRLTCKKNKLTKNEAATVIQDWWRSRMVIEGVDLGRTSESSTRPTYGKRESRHRNQESRVGSEMRELTSQRVAYVIMMSLVLSSVLNYSETDPRKASTVVMLHDMTKDLAVGDKYRELSVRAARKSSLPDLYSFKFANEDYRHNYPIAHDEDALRDNEKLFIRVTSNGNQTTLAWISKRKFVEENSMVELLSTFFILIVWFCGAMAFAGPVMCLVVIPIERMIKLLGMLTTDPLGYQTSHEFRKFIVEEDMISKKTMWTPEMLKGMETSFLMSTIVRIGSLMKVGFGSAGVDIIRQNLAKEKKQDILINDRGVTVSCIFLFCDVRQFTDATECLQEEVFVFTNKIAAVVHSICTSYGGCANKNIGDAFLLSWMLSGQDFQPRCSSAWNRITDHIQDADKALLSVIKICFALYHDKYFLKDMSELAKDRLIEKLASRAGPIVQIGFGLHAGKAVQGAIGTQRKLDASFVSETVEMAETLESLTKRYGVQVLMSESFHAILSPKVRRACRRVDRILTDHVNIDYDDLIWEEALSNIYTYDMDIDAKWSSTNEDANAFINSHQTERESRRVSETSIGLRGYVRRTSSASRRGPRKLSPGIPRSSSFSSVTTFDSKGKLRSNSLEASVVLNKGGGEEVSDRDPPIEPIIPDLELPSGTSRYNSSVWESDDMKKIRAKYDVEFLKDFDDALKCFYLKDWEQAEMLFRDILEIMDDGPSRYFLNTIIKHNKVPPVAFPPYSVL